METFHLRPVGSSAERFQKRHSALDLALSARLARPVAHAFAAATLFVQSASVLTRWVLTTVAHQTIRVWIAATRASCLHK